jgi:hypothetical protein
VSAQYGGKRVDRIADGGAPRYGDVVNSSLQDNAFDAEYRARVDESNRKLLAELDSGGRERAGQDTANG